MAKTGKQIQGDVYRLFKDSTLYTMISGEVYREGYRPRDSRLEDAVVIFDTGLSDEIQTGIVTVDIYVPDIDPYGNGVLVEDGQRTEQLERLAQAWADSLTAEVSCYMFKLGATIYTEYEPDINQHFVVVKLKYRYYGDDDAPMNIPQAAYVDAIDTDDNEDYTPLLETETDDVVFVQPVMQKKIDC